MYVQGMRNLYFVLACRGIAIAMSTLFHAIIVKPRLLCINFVKSTQYTNTGCESFKDPTIHVIDKYYGYIFNQTISLLLFIDCLYFVGLATKAYVLR